MKKITAYILMICLVFTSGFWSSPYNANASENDYDYSSYYYSNYSDLELSTNEIDITVGCRAGVFVYGGSYQYDVYSTNPKVATIDDNGMVTAKKKGETDLVFHDKVLDQDATCHVVVKKKLTDAKIRKKILKLKKRYPEGMYWTNEVTDRYGNRGCFAFMTIVCEYAFGGSNRYFKQHKSFKKIHAGDHIRIGNYHSVVVLEKKAKSVIVCEANYNCSVHWGREITLKDLRRTGFYVETYQW